MTNRNKNILLGVLIIGVVSMTIAFAALSTTLNISGTANVEAAKWDVHFENWRADYPVNGQISGVQNKATQVTGATMSPSNKGTSISGLVVTLNQPGDTAVYKFDIVNDGTINAKLDAFTKSITIQNTSTVPEDISYTVVCGDEASKPSEGYQTLTNGAEPTSNDTLEAGNSRACVLTVIYNEYTNSGTAGQAQTYTGTARTLSITANWVWVQGNTSAQSGGNEPAPVVTWDTYYTPTQTSGASTLPANSQYWIQENTTAKELCGVYSNGTICMTNSTTGRSSDFASVSSTTNDITTVQALQATGLQGYSLTKAEEMINSGVTSCSVYTDSVLCRVTGMYCYLSKGGYVFCGISGASHYCRIRDNGYIECF